MKRSWVVFALLGMAVMTLSFLPIAFAGEHGGEHGGTAVHEHGGQEHGGAPAQSQPAEPTPEMIRSSINDYIQAQEKENGAFAIFDPEAMKIRNLKLVKVHERVGKTGNLFYSCTDMQDLQSGEMFDLDFDVNNAGGTPKIIATRTRIHKENGNPRFTYDGDNIVPVTH